MQQNRVRSNPPRLRDDEGAVLVEFALLAPFIVVLVLGILEFGTAFRTGNSLERVVSSAGRTASTQGTAPFTDFDVLQVVNAGLAGEDRVTVERVIIYKSSNADGDPLPACTAISPSGTGSFGVPGWCNVYSATQVANTNPGVGFRRTGTPGNLACASGAWDEQWCPTNERDQIPPTVDQVGVQIDVQYDTLTGLVNAGDLDFTRRAVYEIEPLVEV
ncbi:MAG: pilus assembly protein [Acidimicrobiales bacterium]|jgi:Flp pilus assembly pilin Flp|nr:pilus assembly protein [Acidimicrobiales bacterium]